VPAETGIANILHRETLAVIVGTKMFDRGEQCFRAGRVLGVESARGELCGIVRPQDKQRSHYEVRIWVRDDGLAYECTCPIGTSRQFCKHAVAITLAHLDKEKHRIHRESERRLALLRARLLAIQPIPLVDAILAHARIDYDFLAALDLVCDGSGVS